MEKLLVTSSWSWLGISDSERKIFPAGGFTIKGQAELTLEPAESLSTVSPATAWAPGSLFHPCFYFRRQIGRLQALLHIWWGTPPWKICFTKGERPCWSRAPVHPSSQPAAAPAPILLRFQMSSCSNLQSCTVVVKDSFLYFHMVWSLQKAQLIFPKQVRLFSFLPVRDDPAPSTRRAAATSHYSLSFHKHHSALSLLLQTAPSSGMCPLLHEDHFFLTSVLLKCEQLTSACDSRDGWGDRGRWPPACSCSRSDD